MDRKQRDHQLTDAQADQRMNDALRRALVTPPKPHAQQTQETKKPASKKQARKD